MTVQALFVAPNLGVGGAERQWSSLLRGLPAQGVRPHLLTLDGTGRFFDEVALEVPAQCANWNSPWSVSRLPHLIARAPYADVVVVRGFSALLVGGALAAARRVPLVVTEHTDYRTLPPQGYRRWLRPQVTRRLKHVIAVSEVQVPGLLDQGYRREAIEFIPNGVPAASTMSRDWRANNDISEDAFLVTLGAALRPEKRIGDFVHAVSEVKRQGIPIVGIVAGGGPQLNEFRQMARDCGSSTRFVDFVEDMDHLLSASDLACLVSEHEVMSMFLLESMAHGLPLVATDVGATRELCRPQTNGQLVGVGEVGQLADAILELAVDRDLRQKYGDESLRIFEQSYDASVMTQRYAEYFRRVARR